MSGDMDETNPLVSAEKLLAAYDVRLRATTAAEVDQGNNIVSAQLEYFCTILCFRGNEFHTYFTMERLVELVCIAAAITKCECPRVLELSMRAMVVIAESIHQGASTIATGGGGGLAFVLSVLGDVRMLTENQNLLDEMLQCLCLITRQIPIALPAVRAKLATQLMIVNREVRFSPATTIKCVQALEGLMMCPELPSVCDAQNNNDHNTSGAGDDDWRWLWLHAMRRHLDMYLPPDSHPCKIRRWKEEGAPLFSQYFSCMTRYCDRLHPRTLESSPKTTGGDDADAEFLLQEIVSLAATALRRSAYLSVESSEAFRIVAMSPLLSLHRLAPCVALAAFAKARVLEVVCSLAVSLLDEECSHERAVDGDEGVEEEAAAAGESPSPPIASGGGAGGAAVEVEDEEDPGSLSHSRLYAPAEGQAEEARIPTSHNTGANPLSFPSHTLDESSEPLLASELAVVPLLEFLLTVIPSTHALIGHVDQSSITLPYHSWMWEDASHISHFCGEKLSIMLETCYTGVGATWKVPQGLLLEYSTDIENHYREKRLPVTGPVRMPQALFPVALFRQPLFSGYIHTRGFGFGNGCTCITSHAKENTSDMACAVRKLLDCVLASTHNADGAARFGTSSGSDNVASGEDNGDAVEDSMQRSIIPSTKPAQHTSAKPWWKKVFGCACCGARAQTGEEMLDHSRMQHGAIKESTYYLDSGVLEKDETVKVLLSTCVPSLLLMMERTVNPLVARHCAILALRCVSPTIKFEWRGGLRVPTPRSSLLAHLQPIASRLAAAADYLLRLPVECPSDVDTAAYVDPVLVGAEPIHPFRSFDILNRWKTSLHSLRVSTQFRTAELSPSVEMRIAMMDILFVLLQWDSWGGEKMVTNNRMVPFKLHDSLFQTVQSIAKELSDFHRFQKSFDSFSRGDGELLSSPAADCPHHKTPWALLHQYATVLLHLKSELDESGAVERIGDASLVDSLLLCDRTANSGHEGEDDKRLEMNEDMMIKLPLPKVSNPLGSSTYQPLPHDGKRLSNGSTLSLMQGHLRSLADINSVVRMSLDREICRLAANGIPNVLQLPLAVESLTSQQLSFSVLAENAPALLMQAGEQLITSGQQKDIYLHFRDPLQRLQVNLLSYVNTKLSLVSMDGCAVMGRQPPRFVKRRATNKYTKSVERCMATPLHVRASHVVDTIMDRVPSTDLSSVEYSSMEVRLPTGGGSGSFHQPSEPKHSEIPALAVKPLSVSVTLPPENKPNAKCYRTVSFLGYELQYFAHCPTHILHLLLLPRTTMLSVASTICRLINSSHHRSPHTTHRGATPATSPVVSTSGSPKLPLHVSPPSFVTAKNSDTLQHFTALTPRHILFLIGGQPFVAPLSTVVEVIEAAVGFDSLFSTRRSGGNEGPTHAVRPLIHNLSFVVLKKPLPWNLFTDKGCGCFTVDPLTVDCTKTKRHAAGGRCPHFCSPSHLYQMNSTLSPDLRASLSLLQALTVVTSPEFTTPHASRLVMPSTRLNSALIHQLYGNISAFFMPGLLYSDHYRGLTAAAAAALPQQQHHHHHHHQVSMFALWSYPRIFPFAERLLVFSTLQKTHRLCIVPMLPNAEGRDTSFVLQNAAWLNDSAAGTRNITVEVSRAPEDLLRYGGRILRRYANCPLRLDFCFSGEAGIGLGPALEFFELYGNVLTQNVSLEMWRTEEVAAVPAAGTTAEQESSGVDGAMMSFRYTLQVAPLLFPAPRLSSASLHHFHSLGLLVGRQLVMKRTSRFRFHPLFLEALRDPEMQLTQPPSRASANMAELYPEMEQSLRQLEKMSHEELAGLNLFFDTEDEIAMPGCDGSLATVDESHRGFEKKDRSDETPLPAASELNETTVTTENVRQYTALIRERHLDTPLRKALLAFRSGLFYTCHPTHLSMFSAYELDVVFSGPQGKIWASSEEFCHSVVASHGYHMSSRVVRDLLDVVGGWSMEQQRLFLRFVTGCSTIGVLGLQPPLTVVRRDVGAEEAEEVGVMEESSPLTPPTVPQSSDWHQLEVDGMLPSVSTCFHYLKLPNYSCREVLAERLLKAIEDGQGSFDLS